MLRLLKYSLVGFVFSVSVGSAQQTSQFTNYIFNYYSINPAASGAQKCMNFKVGYRSQWTGFEGRPETSFANFYMPLKLRRRSASKAKHIVGGYVDKEWIGPFGSTRLCLSYAYHMQLTRSLRASAGLFAGVKQFRVNATRMSVNDYGDPLLPSSGNVLLIPDITPGIMLYQKNWFAGMSIRQMIPMTYEIVGTTESKLTSHFELVGYRRIEYSKKWSWSVSGMLKWAASAAPALDFNVMVEHHKGVEFGLGYRNVDAIAALVKFRILRYYTIGYAFDYTTSALQHAGSNTHEIVLGINTCGARDPRDRMACPAFD